MTVIQVRDGVASIKVVAVEMKKNRWIWGKFWKHTIQNLLIDWI